MESALIVKEDGAKQRTDVQLTEAVARTLGEMILAGESIHPRKGKLQITTITEEGLPQTEELSVNTLEKWISRGNVIPETGQSLRAYLDEKRDEKRTETEQARQSAIRENAEKRLEELSGIKIKPIESKKTYKYNPITGEKFLVKEETIEGSAKLAEVVVKGLQFGLERLNPQRYGPKAEVQHNHFVFDLVKLREARQKRDMLKGDATLL